MWNFEQQFGNRRNISLNGIQLGDVSLLLFSLQSGCVTAVVLFTVWRCVTAVVSFTAWRCVTAVVSFTVWRCVTAVVSFTAWRCVTAVVSFSTNKFCGTTLRNHCTDADILHCTRLMPATAGSECHVFLSAVWQRTAKYTDARCCLLFRTGAS